MINENHPKFLGLIGKTIAKVHLSNSHGEIVKIAFTDGTRLEVCSVDDPDTLYVSVNDKEL